MSRRIAFAAAACVIIALGLLVHLRGSALSPDARDIAGDALWAAMIACWVGALVPRAPIGARAIAAYGWCVLTEMSQLYHAPAVDAIRASRLGHLVLGSGFDPRDLASYAAGVIIAVGIEWIVGRTPTRARPASSPTVSRSRL